MEQPVEQPCNCDFRLYGKKRKNALYKYSDNENIPYQFYKYINNIKMLIKVYIIHCSEKISYLFKFIRFSTRWYTHYKWVNWFSCAVLP